MSKELVDAQTQLILTKEKLEVAIKTIVAMTGPDFDSVELGETNEARKKLAEIVGKVLTDAAKAERERKRKEFITTTPGIGGDVGGGVGGDVTLSGFTIQDYNIVRSSLHDWTANVRTSRP